MKTKYYVTLASAALGMAAATTAQAEDGYDAPAGWPSPVV
ncbi:copper resistance protein B, partial [Vreelandella sulfidaeris]